MKMKHVFIMLCAAYCSLFSTPVSAQQWGWIRRVYENTDLSAAQPVGMDVDAQGNIYHCGFYTIDPVFPNAISMNATSLGKPQASLCKVSPDGTYLWARRLNGGSVASRTYCLSNGNIAVYGGITGNTTSWTFNGITYTPRNKSSLDSPCFFLIYDKDGNELYSQVFQQYASSGTAGTASSYSIGNDIYLFQVVDDTLWYNNTFLTMPAGAHGGLFRIKIDGTNGNVKELIRMGNSTMMAGFPIEVVAKPNGETFLCSKSSIARDFGNGVVIPSSAGLNNYVVKFDDTGKALWATYTSQTVPGDYLSSGLISLDENYNPYVSIGYSNQIQVNGNMYYSLNTDVENHIVYSLDDATGKIRFVNHFNKTSGVDAPADGITALKSNGKGFMYAVGNTTGMEHFGDFYYQNNIPHTPSSSYTNDYSSAMCFLLKMDTSGVVNRFRYYGEGTTDERPLVVSTFGDDVYVGMRAKGTVFFDNPTFTYTWDESNAAYADDGVLAVFNDCNAQISVNGSVMTASSGTAYQWYLNGTAIDGATSQTYTLPANAVGNYTVQVTFAGGCVSKSATLPFKNIATGTVESSAAAALMAYPNPASDQLTLSVANPGNGANVTLTIFNAEGQEMKTIQFPNWSAESEYVTNVKDFPQGLYFVKMVCGSQSLNTKFIKQ